MGRFLDEAPALPAKTYKGKFLDDVITPEVVPAKKTSPAYGGWEGVKRFGIGGLPAYGTTPGSEDVLPAVGQTLGSVGGFGGSVAGATAGQAARQGIKAIRGTRDSQPRQLFGVGPKAPGIVNDLAGEAAGTATIEGLTRGASRIIPKVANRMMLSVLKPGREVIKRNPNLGLEVAEAGITGTKSGMLSKAEKLIEQGENQLKPFIKNSSKTISAQDVAKQLDEIKRVYGNVNDPQALQAIKEAEDALTSRFKFGQYGKMTLEEANQLKRDLYKVLKDSQYGKGVGEIPVKADARKALARGLKKGIESAIPEAKAINKKMGTAITAREALENSLANSQKAVLLPKLAGMGAGAALLTGNPLMAAGIYAGDRLTDVVRSAPMITGAAKNLLRLRKFGKPAAVAGAEFGRRIFGG